MILKQLLNRLLFNENFILSKEDATLLKLTYNINASFLCKNRKYSIKYPALLCELILAAYLNKTINEIEIIEYSNAAYFHLVKLQRDYLIFCYMRVIVYGIDNINFINFISVDALEHYRNLDTKKIYNVNWGKENNPISKSYQRLQRHINVLVQHIIKEYR